MQHSSSAKHHGIEYCVDKEHDVALVIQCSQHEPSTLLSFICLGYVLQVQSDEETMWCRLG